MDTVWHDQTALWRTYYSGHMEENAPHSDGVAFMLSRTAEGALLDWEPLSSRIITATFCTDQKRFNLLVIQCYAPTNEAEEETKTEFYEQLQEAVRKATARDIVIMMGDFNAKIGSNNKGYELVMGKQATGSMNENGEKLADFCLDNDLVIGGSIFPHKTIHKNTWVSPDHVTENQIDFVCYSRKFRRSVLDTRVKRGADVASDHHLVTASVKLKLKRNENKKQATR